MRYLICITLFCVTAVTAAAQERKAFYGSWGAEQQCARALFNPGGQVRAAPYEIGDQWLKHGRFWCRLNWFPVERREDGLFTAARVQCGEDALRDYLLGMSLSDGKLTLRWDFQLVGPLARCPNS